MATGGASRPAETTEVVGVIGARGFVGRSVVAALATAGTPVLACSRDPRVAQDQAGVTAGSPRAWGPGGVRWARIGGAEAPPVTRWIATCALWCLPEWLPWLEGRGIDRLVALSSTSRFTKRDSSSAADRATARRLVEAETLVGHWAEHRGVSATILQPTLIYDGVHDRNVARIAGFVRRFGVFPVVGAAEGIRQPVHVDDVAAACVAAVRRETAAWSYTLSGGESLPFRELVSRIFAAEGRPPRFLTLPRWTVRPGLALARLVGVEGITAGMFERMGEDLVFGHEAAARDLGFRPRPFALPPTGRGRHAGTGS